MNRAVEDRTNLSWQHRWKILLPTRQNFEDRRNLVVGYPPPTRHPAESSSTLSFVEMSSQVCVCVYPILLACAQIHRVHTQSAPHLPCFIPCALPVMCLSTFWLKSITTSWNDNSFSWMSPPLLVNTELLQGREQGGRRDGVLQICKGNTGDHIQEVKTNGGDGSCRDQHLLAV